MTSTSAPFNATSHALVPAGASVRALAVIAAMCAMQVVAVASPSPAQGPPGLH